MRIALFTETFLPKTDGIVTRLTHTVRHLVAAGDDVLVVAPAPGEGAFAGAAVHRATAFPFPLYPELRLAPPWMPGIGRAVRAFGPEVVHVVNPAMLGVAGIALAGRLGVPLVASYHTHVPKYLEHYKLGRLEGLCWRLIRAMHNRAARNLCTSAAMVETLRAHRVRHVELWRRGVDTDRFRPDLRSEAVRAELAGGGPFAGRLLLYVGRLAAEKEIERIRPVLEALPGARLALVGDGPARAKLQRHFAGAPARFVGYRHGEALAAAFASADALILPSRTETLGLVLLEAMAAGCPVVAARAGGITDVVDDGRTGCLFDPDDPDGAIAATRRLLDGGAPREAMRRDARAEAERWGWPAATEHLRGHYAAVRATSPAAAPAPGPSPTRVAPAPPGTPHG
jgi:glycosyltransferase involved in cell wall biosynthesis